MGEIYIKKKKRGSGGTWTSIGFYSSTTGIGGRGALRVFLASLSYDHGTLLYGEEALRMRRDQVIGRKNIS